MVGSNKRPRPGGLLSELDRRISRLLNDYLVEEQATTGTPAKLPSTSMLVDYVREVDVGLRRNKTLQLEKSIQRVMPGIRQQLEHNQQSATSDAVSSAAVQSVHSSDEEPEIDGSSRFDALESVPTMEVKDTNAMNGSLMRLWGTKAADTATATDKRSAAEAPEQTSGDSKREKDLRKKKRTRGTDRATHEAPTTRLSDLGGVDACIEEIQELIVMPLTHPEIYTHMGVVPPRGVLLHGPPGCGKTLLANAIAGEVGVPFLQISAPSVVSGMSGESEKKLREVFEEARELAPCLLFIDEIDAITPKRENAQREMERRIVAQMLTCIDDLSWEKTGYKPVMLIGATNRPDSLDPALRRAGRFDREIAMAVPDQPAREQILKVLCQRMMLSGDFDIKELAKRTPGYVGADLTALTTAAGMIAVKRIFHALQNLPAGDGTPSENQAAGNGALSENLADKLAQTTVEGDSDGHDGMMSIDSDIVPASTPARWDAEPAAVKLRTIAGFLKSHPHPLTPEELSTLAISNADFIHALAKVQPSAKREGFATVPGVTWDDIGALSRVRDELRMAIVEPIRNPEIFARVGITAPAGVLLWGPPGNGKTLLAKAIANESHTNFISVKGGELMSKYVGDSERAVRQVFTRARASSPCVVFFDELDALCSRRGGEQSEASARVVNTLLTEIDGMEARKKVYVIAATNRPDIIDPAMLRPGRLDKLLYVELPTPAERADILRTLAKNTPLSSDVSMDDIARDERCTGFSGADLVGLLRQAAEEALRSALPGTTSDAPGPSQQSIFVTRANFDTALQRTAPSVSATDMKRYEALRKLYGS
ncbi:Ribosome biogenesis ATPase rix7 [Coemansia sp. RSA 1853]|nr:Ribosome biogenesis ATPase rix7 [Coemansia sp. RSA 1853]